MRSDFEDTFALQRLYEKWVVKEEWLVNEEAIPLLLGTDPTTDFLTSEYKQLQNRIQTAISEGDIKTVTGSTETSDHIKVQPAIIYQWAMTNRLTLWLIMPCPCRLLLPPAGQGLRSIRKIALPVTVTRARATRNKARLP